MNADELRERVKMVRRLLRSYTEDKQQAETQLALNKSRRKELRGELASLRKQLEELTESKPWGYSTLQRYTYSFSTGVLFWV